MSLDPQSAIRYPLSICALLAALLLYPLATRAQDQEIANDEGPYLEGVFAREAGPPLILPARQPEYEPAPLFDEEGNSNNVIVLLDFDAPAFDPVLSGKAEPGDQLPAEQAIFPESQLSAMAAQGYTQNSGSDWIGYVYPNTNGNVPAIN
jgi:hypothetical protein